MRRSGENEDVDATRLAAEEQDPAVEDIPESALEPEPVAEFEQPAPDFDPGALAAEEPEFETRAEVEPLEEPAPAESEAPPRRHSDTPTQGFDALAEDDEPFEEESQPPPAEGTEELADRDPLEDTPDFLEETPEHDRLWFEQRPPRDFDFD